MKIDIFFEKKKTIEQLGNQERKENEIDNILTI